MPTKHIIGQIKRCAKCGEEKDVTRFYARAVGFSENCRKCRKPMSNAQKVIGGLKQCTGCNNMRPLSNFGVHPNSSSGRKSHCKPCTRNRWRGKHPIDPVKVAIPLPDEEWHPVVGFEAEFSVSNFGRVRRDMGINRTFPNRLLKPHLGTMGYYTVALHGRTTLIHRLVAEAFLEPDPNRPHVNHKNGVKTDSRADNLEWVTHAENMAHAAKTLNSWRRGQPRVDV